MATVLITPKGKMQPKLQWLATVFVALALSFLSLKSVADDADNGGVSAASAHVLQAEIARHRMDYLTAASEYRQAAELSESIDIAREATQIAWSYGFYEDALASAERWLELDEDNEEALFHVARLQLRLGDIRASRRSYRKLIELDGESADKRLLDLVGVLLDEDPEGANDIVRWLAKRYKNSAYAHYAAAIAAVQIDDIDYAQKRVQAAIELKPDWMKPKLLYGRTLLLAGDEAAAIDYVARLIGDDPQPDPEARMELALLMMAVGRDDDALSQVNQIQYETGNQPDALRLMAILNFRQQNLDAAWEDFQDLLSTGRHTMEANFYLARISDFRGESDRAIRLYSKVENGSHTITAQRRAAALIAFQRNSPDIALERLDDFARDNWSYAVDMALVKAQLLASLERHDESLALYDRMVEYRPDSEGVSLGRAELLLRMERLDESIAQYRKTVSRWPDSATALNALGYTLADHTDQYGEAEKLIRQALELEPTSAAIIDSLGWVLHKLGRHDEALDELTRAYATLDDPEVASHIVEVMIALNRPDEALEFLAAAEAKSPENALLKDVRDRLFAGVE